MECTKQGGSFNEVGAKANGCGSVGLCSATSIPKLAGLGYYPCQDDADCPATPKKTMKICCSAFRTAVAFMCVGLNPSTQVPSPDGSI